MSPHITVRYHPTVAAKPARSVRVNDRIEIRQPGSVRELLVLGLGAMRGPAESYSDVACVRHWRGNWDR